MEVAENKNAEVKENKSMGDSCSAEDLYHVEAGEDKMAKILQELESDEDTYGMEVEEDKIAKISQELKGEEWMMEMGV